MSEFSWDQVWSEFQEKLPNLVLLFTKIIPDTKSTLFSKPVICLIIKPGALRLANAWFLEITFVPPKYVCVCVCVCVHPRGHK